jgi:predicted NodU family carbamoyl transferase
VLTKDHPFYEILNYFLLSRNKLAVINTSFNTHEEPIVSNLSTALTALGEDRVDVVFTIEKIYLRNSVRASFQKKILAVDSSIAIFH